MAIFNSYVKLPEGSGVLMGYDWDIDGHVSMMQGVYLNIEWEYIREDQPDFFPWNVALTRVFW